MQKKTLDIVGIGECLVEFAEIEPRQYRQSYSGDILNALWMASALGLKCGLVSRLGDDPFTPGLIDVLNEANIDLSFSPRVGGRPNGVYYVLESGERKVFHFVRKGSAATQTFSDATDGIEAYLKQSRFVLFSAIPLAIMESPQNMLDVLHRCSEEATICFDLNVRVALWPDLSHLREHIAKLASVVTFLFVSMDDDKALYGERDVEAALRFYGDLGYRNVIVRQGSDPTVVLSNDRLIRVSTIPNLTVTDPTGAGDAFNAGFIAAQAQGKDIETSTAYGNAAAASVLAVVGGRAVGVTPAMVEKFVEQILSEAQA